MIYTICDSHGKPLMIGDTNTAHVSDIPLESGNILVAGRSPNPEEYLDVPSMEFVQMSQRPSMQHTFDYTTKQWVDPRTLQDLQLAKWNAIKQARANAEFGGFTWDGSPFDSDAISQSRIQGALQLAAMIPGFTIDWTLANNTVRTLSGADIAGVGVALGQHVATQHAKARVLRAHIEAATTAAEVDAVVW